MKNIFSTEIITQPSWPVFSALVEDVVITRSLCSKEIHLSLRFSLAISPFARFPFQTRRKAVHPPISVAIDKKDMVQ